MKRTLALIFAMIAITTLSACQPQTETKYLETSVTQEFIGTMTFRTESEYDEDGTLLTFTQYTDGVETSRVQYSYTDNSIIGEVTQNGETGTTKQVYQKDATGNITHIEFYLDEVLYSVSDATHDENGNILTNTQQTIVTERTTTVTYTYDDDGNPLTITYEYGNDIGSVTENTYDENGKLLTSIVSDLQGNVTNREEYSRNETNVETVSIYDGDGNLTGTRTVTYDEAGNMLTSETFDASGTLTLRITYTYEKIEVPVNNEAKAAGG